MPGREEREQEGGEKVGGGNERKGEEESYNCGPSILSLTDLFNWGLLDADSAECEVQWPAVLDLTRQSHIADVPTQGLRVERDIEWDL